MLFVYLFVRTSFVFELVPDSGLILRMEYGCFFILFPLMGVFLDLILKGKTGLFINLLVNQLKII